MRALAMIETGQVSGGCFDDQDTPPIELMDTITVTATYEGAAAAGFNFGELVAIGGITGGAVGLHAWLTGAAGTMTVDAAITVGTLVGAGVTVGAIVAFSAGYAVGTYFYNTATGYIYRPR